MKNLIYILALVVGVLLFANPVSGKMKQEKSIELVKIDTILVSGENQYALGTLTRRCTFVQILDWAKKNNFELVDKDDLKIASNHISGLSVLGISSSQNLESLNGKLWIWALNPDRTLRRWPDTQVFGGHWFTNAPYKILLKVSPPLIVKNN